MLRILLLTTLSLILLTAGAYAANGSGPADDTVMTPRCRFIDEDGDGFNDLAPDHDGDGVPNGLDPDYVRPLDGTGQQFMHRKGMLSEFRLDGKGFGLNGNFYGPSARRGNAYGPGDGTGTGVGPADGTGFGPGTGGCDGTGPHGQNVQGRRQGRR